MAISNSLTGGILMILWIILLIPFFYGIYGVYYAYVKTKDERQKYIVMRSASHTLAVLFGYYFLELIAWIAPESQWFVFWSTLHNGYDSDSPLLAMTVVLGIFLFINKRKMGGS